MRVYVLFAHPSHASFCKAALEQFVRGLRDSGHEYDLCDLYSVQFAPSLDEDEFERERGRGQQGAAASADVVA